MAVDPLEIRAKELVAQYRDKPSKFEIFQQKTPEEKARLLEGFTDADKANLMTDPDFVCRPKQIATQPDGINRMLYLCGRAFGKTFVGGMAVNQFARENPGCFIMLIGKSTDDATGVMADAIKETARPNEITSHVKSDRMIYFANGSRAKTFTALKPDGIAGANADMVWFDECALSAYAQKVYDTAGMALRKGKRPFFLLTTTPRPTDFIRKLVKSKRVHVVTGTSFENVQLPLAYFVELLATNPEGSAQYQQEILAQILSVNNNALFSYESINNNRLEDEEFKIIKSKPDYREKVKVIIGVDPGGFTAKADRDKTGIIVSAIYEDEAYILHDGTMRGPPKKWAEKVVDLYHIFKADLVICEKNQGGVMNSEIIANQDATVKVELFHSSVSKEQRAQPVSALFDNGKVHLVSDDPKGDPDKFSALEIEMTQFDPTLGRAQKSPDHLDALVFSLQPLIKATQKVKASFF